MTEPDPEILALAPEDAAPLLYGPWRDHVNGGGYGTMAPPWPEMATLPGTLDALVIRGWVTVAARVQAAASALAAERDRLQAENTALRDEMARAARLRRGPARRSARPEPLPGARATMRDVAARAGVGLKTVSRVVNDEPGVSPPTAARVTAAISELSFRPNEAARFLRTGRVPAAPGNDAARAVITEELLRADAAAIADDDITDDDLGDAPDGAGQQAQLPFP